MFDRPKSIALGAAVASGLAASFGGPPAGAAPPPASPATSSGDFCATRALPRGAAARGERSPVFCAASPAQASGLLKGQGPAPAAGFLSTQSTEMLLAWHFTEADLRGARLDVYGPDCGTEIPQVPEPFASRFRSTQMHGCSQTKMYTGEFFTGEYVFWDDLPNTGFGIPPSSPVYDNLHSLRYGT